MPINQEPTLRQVVYERARNNQSLHLNYLSGALGIPADTPLNSRGMSGVQNYLNLISQYESNNQNVVNYRYDPTHTAQGYYQITNSNWTAYAPQVGIDLAAYPTAMSAPQDLQAQVATYLLTSTPAGIGNWANYNTRLATALANSGLQTSGAVTDGYDTSGLSVPTGDGSSNILGMDLSSVDPTQVAMVLGAGLLVMLLAGK